MSGSDWRSLDGIPLDGEEPVFAEPWQAQAFAMTVALNERGAIAWADWAQTLGTEIAAHPDADYWTCWLAALETTLARDGIADEDAVARRTEEWHAAAARTPHGEPIEL